MVSSARVPPNGNRASVSCPLYVSAISLTKNSPSPIPLPTSLVVKNGCPARRITSSVIPGPSSSTANTSSAPAPFWPPAALARRPTCIFTAVPPASNAFFSSTTIACCTFRTGTLITRQSAATSTATRPRSSSRKSSSTNPTKSAAAITVGRREASDPTSILIRLMIFLHRSTSWRISVASSAIPAPAGCPDSPIRALRSSSFAATAIVPKGDPSSCAAPAAKVVSAASCSFRAFRSRTSDSSASRLLNSPLTRPIKYVISPATSAIDTHCPNCPTHGSSPLMSSRRLTQNNTPYPTTASPAVTAAHPAPSTTTLNATFTKYKLQNGFAGPPVSPNSTLSSTTSNINTPGNHRAAGRPYRRYTVSPTFVTSVTETTPNTAPSGKLSPSPHTATTTAPTCPTTANHLSTANQ